MGSGKHSQLYQFLSRRMNAMFVVLMVLVSIIGYLYFMENRLDAQRNSLIDTMGRQRMLSQLMAKEANRVSLLYAILENPESSNGRARILATIGSSKQRIVSARVEFDRNLNDIRNGIFLYQGRYLTLDTPTRQDVKPIIESLTPIWSEFQQALAVIEEMEAQGPENWNAMLRINSTDELILTDTMRINDVLLDGMSKSHNEAFFVFVAIFVLILVTVFIILYGIYRDLMLPMDTFFTKVSEVGLSKRAFSIPHGRITPIIDEMNGIMEGSRDIVHLIENINQKSSFEDTLQFIYTSFKKYIPYSYIGIALFDLTNPTYLHAAYGISEDPASGIPERLLGESTDISETSLMEVAQTRKPRIINDLEAYSKARKPKEHTQIVMDSGIRSSITLPLAAHGKVLGFIFFSSDKKNEYSEKHSDFLETIVNALAISFEKNIFVDELLYSSVLALAKLAEAKDEDTAVHLDRIKEYTTIMANCLKNGSVYSNHLTDSFVKDLIRFSPMHDIGKVGIRDDILLKPGKLDKDEFEHIKTHTTFGANVLIEAEQNILRTGRSMFKIGIEIAGGHHEKWDGNGYPQKLSKEEIPLSARIVAVMDVFDALTTRRPYKEPYPFDDAVEMIRQGAGNHFDPVIVDHFLLNSDKFRERWEVFYQEQPEVFQTPGNR